MNKEEKIVILAEILEVEVDELKDNKLLNDFETWDSVAVLTIIAMLDEKFGKYKHASEIKEYKTVGELLDAME